MRIIILFLIFLPLVSAGQSGIIVQQDTSGGNNFILADVMPQFPGGHDSMISYLSKHLIYPAACLDSNISGIVYVKFVVDTFGHISNAQVLHKVHPMLDAESMLVVAGMPNWQPALKDGIKVPVYYILPIKFLLTEQDPDNKKPIVGHIDTMPKYIGGLSALLNFITDNTNYPNAYKDSNLAVNVLVDFTVTAEGHITNAKISRPRRQLFDEEALRVVRSMPDWKPGIKNGKNVDVPYYLMVPFKLDKSGKNVLATKSMIFAFADKMPEFPGGSNALLNYISKNIVYPFEAKVNNVQGTVYVQFAVDTSGRVTDVKVLRKVADDLDAEALRVVRNMPQWQPGEFQGEKVSIYYTVPIHFQLTD